MEKTNPPGSRLCQRLADHGKRQVAPALDVVDEFTNIGIGGLGGRGCLWVFLADDEMHVDEFT